MASENIGNVYPTKIPGYDDAADIQAALRLYHYGSEAYDVNNTDLAQLVNPSLAYTLNDLQDQIDDALANPAAAADVQDAEPINPVDGFLWLQSNAVVSGFPISATSVYQNTEPTFGLADGLIWARANTTPIQLEIYDQTSNTFNEVTLPSQSGNSGKYLTTDGANPSWTTPASGGGLDLLSSTSMTGSSLTISSISQDYDQLVIVINNAYFSSGSNGFYFQLRCNSDTGTNYNWGRTINTSGGSYNGGAAIGQTSIQIAQQGDSSTTNDRLGMYIVIPNYKETIPRIIRTTSMSRVNDPTFYDLCATYTGSSAIDSLTFFTGTGTMSDGTIKVYGVK
jgi:hypothetical protein